MASSMASHVPAEMRGKTQYGGKRSHILACQCSLLNVSTFVLLRQGQCGAMGLCRQWQRASRLQNVKLRRNDGDGPGRRRVVLLYVSLRIHSGCALVTHMSVDS